MSANLICTNMHFWRIAAPYRYHNQPDSTFVACSRILEGLLSGGLQSGCPPSILVAVNVFLALVDGVLATVAFLQLLRIHLHNQNAGWTRQKVFHVMIGFANTGFSIYFVFMLFTTCGRCLCWSLACRFILMACPQILFVAAFLLILSFWVDVCHPTNDDDGDEELDNSLDPLLEKEKLPGSLPQIDGCWNFLSCHRIHVGNRQKFVILVTTFVFILMIAFSALIWIGKGKNPIDSSLVARVYLDLFSVAILLLGGALACYGILLIFKMKRIRSERASSEMWKVGGLAIVSIICFSSCALVAIITNVPVLYSWDSDKEDGARTSFLMVVYYFIGSSMPSAFVLWVMREMPTRLEKQKPTYSGVVNPIRGAQASEQRQHRWTKATSSQNQVSAFVYLFSNSLSSPCCCSEMHVCLRSWVPCVETCNCARVLQHFATKQKLYVGCAQYPGAGVFWHECAHNVKMTCIAKFIVAKNYLIRVGFH